jgi:hydroxymethylpyrimidine kinase/phosphomethylpyrimidine kinase
MGKGGKKYYPSALTVAGSDSGGGAGIQADLRTFSAFGVYGCSVITAVTAQNPYKVSRVDPLPADSVAAQLTAALEAFSINSVKTGMLFSVDIIEAIAPFFEQLSVPIVVDPVMVSTSGAKLLEESAVEMIKERIFPAASWITPNIPEAELLLGGSIAGLNDMKEAAQECSIRWDCGCVLKGGHAGAVKGKMSDIVAYKGKVLQLTSPAIDAKIAAHGTGCTFSSAIAASFALGLHWKEALASAKSFVYGSLAEAVQLGGKLHAMYPPTESCLENVSLGRIK